MQTEEKAYAKINYSLYVGDRREDGYHEILTVMQTVSLHDEVSVTAEPGSGIHLVCDAPYPLPEDRSNLAYRAAEVFLSHAEKSLKVSIRLVKHIPAQAGLGGGSADAAAVLRALNRLTGEAFTTEELGKMGAEIGSDVPFCVFGGSAVCTGRGDEAVPIPALPRYPFLIVSTGEAVSTKDAYRLLDGSPKGPLIPENAERVCEALRAHDGNGIRRVLQNDFEDAVLPLCPFAARAREELIACGAVAALLSGSGSSVFGIFRNEREALLAQSHITSPSVFCESV